MGVLTLEDKIEKFLTLGYGSGDGNGNGNGYGYGSGYGDGSGDGNGSGDGSGYGDGSGDGNGVIQFNGYKLYTIDTIPTAITAVHGSYAEGFTIRHNSEMVPCYIARVGDFFAHGKTLKEARRDAQQKFDDSLPTEEKIQRFIAFCDGKDYIPAADLFQWHHTLTGSCEMGRRQFCEAHNIDINKDKFTVAEFIKFTEHSFGSDVIRQLKETINGNN